MRGLSAEEQLLRNLFVRSQEQAKDTRAMKSLERMERIKRGGRKESDKKEKKKETFFLKTIKRRQDQVLRDMRKNGVN